MKVNRRGGPILLPYEGMSEFVDDDGEEHGDRPQEDVRELAGGLEAEATAEQKAGQPKEPVNRYGKSEKTKAKHRLVGKEDRWAWAVFRLLRSPRGSVGAHASLDDVVRSGRQTIAGMMDPRDQARLCEDRLR